MSQSSGRARRVAFVFGLTLAWVAFLALAEGYLLLFPPRDLHPFLGEASPLTGPFVADPDFGVAYRSWETFRADNAERLAPYLPLHNHPDRRPTWAFFGNSFVQAPGMLADTARAALPERRIFNLGRNEYLFVRLAQIKMLLESGLAPERVFLLIMPLDLGSIGQQPLATIRATTRGALVYEPRHPAGTLGWLTRHSRTAFTAWARTGRQCGDPGFRLNTLCGRPSDRLLADTEHLFASLARIARAHGVPVTVMLVPSYTQTLGRDNFGLQDTLAPMLRTQGLDVFDPRDAFVHAPDPAGLYLPDKHFNERGNRLLLQELLRHLHYQDRTSPTPEPRKT